MDGNVAKPLSFQAIILKLQHFWAQHGCVLMQPYDIEVGAGTFHPATTLRVLGTDPWRVAYVQPSRRPSDGRYGDNPNRVQLHHQFQVILKPSPTDCQELYLQSLEEIGINAYLHDIRFVEDNWEGPTLGASGLGWEVWCDGQEVTQFTFMQQMGGLECYPIAAELTYGLERIAMIVQGVSDMYDIDWNGASGDLKMTYRDVCHRNEREFSAYNFEYANVEKLFTAFNNAEQECQSLVAVNLALPAYDQCLKASHTFNLLDARGVISVVERAGYISRVRALAKMCCETYFKNL